MMDVIPFMILATVVVLVVAGWGYLRADKAGVAAGDEWVPARDVEALFLECLAEKGVAIPELRVYREAGGLVIVGPEDLDSNRRRALSACDAAITAQLREASAAES